ncbi:uncharacterized protein LOC124455081 [Xenia sp. Carnegie-2017]|uniref:uncharacterized protein LOC124455081 n=1 Tax=Xenia sp. Carnegie-2017 TaxID=2897299 RepID=UPI001F045C1B|nr:uncharacterized protein LOC124455081 [Xenia sp. Carnegie-2017]
MGKKQSRHQSTIAEENEPIVKDNVQNVVDEPQKDNVGEISVNEHNGPTNKTLSEEIENVSHKTMSPLSRNEQRQLAIQACDKQNEDSTVAMSSLFSWHGLMDGVLISNDFINFSARGTY